MNRRLIAGVMLFLSTVSGYAADRMPENGYGIVPMPYETKARAGDPFVITKETVLVSKGTGAENCAAYLQERLRQSCGLNLQTATAARGKIIVLTDRKSVV